MALNTNKKGLGRGLSSLMGDTDAQQNKTFTSSSEIKISVVVESEKGEAATQQLHDAFFLSKS